MKIRLVLPFTSAVVLLATSSFASAQNAGKPAVKLDGKGTKEATNLDPAGKLPSANKEDMAPTPVLERTGGQAQLPSALRKLTKDQIGKYQELTSEATAYLRTVRLQEGLQKLMEAQQHVGETVGELENLRGAIYTKLKDYDNARQHFKKALTLEGELFHPNFNLAELDFVEKKFATSNPAFLSLIGENQKLKEKAMTPEANATPLTEEQKTALERDFAATEKLIKYKVLIGHLFLGETEKADAIMKDFNSFDDDSPAYYFSKACYEFIKLEKVDRESPEGKKHFEKGQDWINSAKGIYSMAKSEVFLDSIVEMGWLQGLQ